MPYQKCKANQANLLTLPEVLVTFSKESSS